MESYSLFLQFSVGRSYIPFYNFCQKHCSYLVLETMFQNPVSVVLSTSYMKKRKKEILIVTLLLLKLGAVVALIAIKTDLNDPYNVLENWDINSVDPCSWRMITCSPDGYVSAM